MVGGVPRPVVTGGGVLALHLTASGRGGGDIVTLGDVVTEVVNTEHICQDQIKKYLHYP